MIRRVHFLPAFGLWFLVACTGSGAQEESLGSPLEAAAPIGRAWTTAFLEPAMLITDVCYLEGPDDLLGHVALRQDPDNLDYSTETTSNGLVQTSTVKPGRSGIEIHAQLDGLQIVAFRKLIVLQRPGEVPIRVRAQGDAFWTTLDGKEERRGEEIELRGVRGQ